MPGHSLFPQIEDRILRVISLPLALVLNNKVSHYYRSMWQIFIESNEIELLNITISFVSQRPNLEMESRSRLKSCTRKTKSSVRVQKTWPIHFQRNNLLYQVWKYLLGEMLLMVCFKKCSGRLKWKKMKIIKDHTVRSNCCKGCPWTQIHLKMITKREENESRWTLRSKHLCVA